MIYHAITRDLTAEGRRKIDAILGDAAAVAERNDEAQSFWGSFAKAPS